MIRIIIYIFLLIVLPDLASADILDAQGWSTATDQMGLPSPNDRSVQYLGYVFGVVNGLLHGTGSQIMGAMFAKFNSAVLVLGGMVVIYTTVMGLLNTAEEGRFLGQKMHSFFVPLRTILGILLISPTSTGYSWIQVIMMYIVLQGVTAANMVWKAAVEYILTGGTIIVQNQDAQSTVGNQVFGAVSGTMSSVTCMALLQRAIDQMTYASNSTSNPIKPPQRNVLETVTDDISAVPLQQATTSINEPLPNFQPSALAPKPGANDDPPGTNLHYENLNGLCGSLSGVNGYNSIAVNQVLSDLNSAVSMIASTCNANCFDSTTHAVTPCPQGTVIPNDGFGCATVPGSNPTNSQCLVHGLVADNNYGSLVSTRGNEYFVTSNIPILYWCSPPTNTTPNYSDVYNMASMDYLGLTYSASGQAGVASNEASAPGAISMKDAIGSSWFSAGAYYFALLQSNEHAQMGQSSGSFSVHTNSIAGAGSDSEGSSTLSMSKGGLQNILSAVGITNLTNQDYFNGLLLPFFSSIATSASKDSNNGIITKFNGDNKQANYGHQQAINFSITNPQGGGVLYIILNALIPGVSSMIMSFVSLMDAQQTNSNPLLLMMMFGNGMLVFAFEMWFVIAIVLAGLTLVLGLVPCVDLSTSMEVFTATISPLLTAILLPMFVTGGMLLYYLPAVPFMIFSFGTIGWIIAVIESMVAAPIVGFAVMAPDAQHDIWGRGEQAVYLALNIFLRPSLMIFGLIAGIMVSYIGVWIINDGFRSILPMIFFAGGNLISIFFALIAIPMVYLIMVMQIVNRSFALIHILPDKVTRWITGGIAETMGSEMAGLEEKAHSAMQSGWKSVGEGVSGAGKGFSESLMKAAAGSKGKDDGTSNVGAPGGGAPPGGAGMV